MLAGWFEEGWPSTVAGLKKLLRGSEVPLYLYGVYAGVFYSVAPPYLLFKVCEQYLWEHGLDAVECYRGVNGSLQAAVEAQNSKYQVIMQLASALPAILSAVLLATWSDEHGRKTPLLMAIVGTVFTGLVLTVSASLPLSSLHWILLSQIIYGLCGHCVIMSLSFAMITDVVKESRILSIRMGIACATFPFGMLCSTLLCSVMEASYAFKFLLACCVQAFSFGYTLVLVKESYVAATEDEARSYSLKESLCQVFSWERFRDYVSTLAKHRAESKRTFILVTLAVFLILYICDKGMPMLDFLFVRLPPLNFSDEDYAQMLTIITASSALSCALLPAILRRLGFTDSAMILFGLIVSILKTIVFTISRHAYMVYISAALSGVATIYFPSLRAYLSHMVEPHETGRVFVSMALMEQIGPLFSALAFSYIYAASVATYPGFVFLVSAAVQSSLFCVMLYLHVKRRRLTVQPLIDADSAVPRYILGVGTNLTNVAMLDAMVDAVLLVMTLLVLILLAFGCSKRSADGGMRRASLEAEKPGGFRPMIPVLPLSPELGLRSREEDDKGGDDEEESLTVRSFNTLPLGDKSGQEPKRDGRGKGE